MNDHNIQVVNTEEDVVASFNKLLEVGLKYISLVAKETERHSQQATAKFWRALLHRGYEILDKVCMQLSAIIGCIQSPIP